MYNDETELWTDVKGYEGAYDHFFHCGIRYFKVVDKAVPEKKLFAMKAVLYGMGDFAVMAFPGKKYDKGWVIKPYFVSDTPLPQYVVTHVSEYFPGSAIYFLKRVDREPSYRSLSELNTLEGAVFHGIYTAHLEYDGSPSMPDLDIWV